MTRVRIILISKPEMNFTETADLLEKCLNDSAFNATCTRIPEEWAVFVTLPAHLQEDLLEWCRISLFAARYIDSAHVEPEKPALGGEDYRAHAVKITKQIMKEVMTYQPTYDLLPDLITDIVARALRDQARAINGQHLDAQLDQAQKSARATLSFALAFADQHAAQSGTNDEKEQ